MESGIRNVFLIRVISCAFFVRAGVRVMVCLMHVHLKARVVFMVC